MRPVSLRGAALVWMTVLLTAVGVVTILIAFLYARQEAAGFLDDQLRQIALNAGASVRPAQAPPSLDEDPENRFAITVWDSAGRVLHASLPNVPLPRPAGSGFANAAADGEQWRLYTIRGTDRTVQVAQRETVREEIAESAALGAAAPVLMVIPLSWLVVGLAMRRVLGRLDRLAQDLAQRSTTAAAPLPMAGIPTEVAPLVTAMNGLLVRLHAALDNQKRFLADAAHELRTPLAAMQIQVDGLAADASPTQATRLSALTAGLRRVSALVAQLLSLARLDEPAAEAPALLDLGPLLLDCVGDYVALAEGKGVDLGVHIRGQAHCRGNAADLRMLFGCLIDNAVRYTPPDGLVDVTLDRQGGQAVVEVLDTGPGLPAGAEARIFDRFFRAAPPGVAGTGLGLAIARRIAERHGLGLSVANRPDAPTRSGVRATVGVPILPGEPAG
jgi:two-component system OmpR family sensor kinase